MDANPEVVSAYRDQLMTEPPKTSSVLKPIADLMGAAGVDDNPRAKAEWILQRHLEDTGHRPRFAGLLRVWKEAGMWVHKQGTLESVLGIGADEKGVEQAVAAASHAGDIDDVADWIAYDVDPLGDVELLLNAEVERIAHALMEATRTSPETVFLGPVGTTADSDSRLVDVEALDEVGSYRLVVKTPVQFAGWFTEFSRKTFADEIVLRKPPDLEASENQNPAPMPGA